MVTRYRPLAYSKGRWIGFPQVHSYGLKKGATKFINQIKKSYRKAGIKPRRMKVVKINIKI